MGGILDEAVALDFDQACDALLRIYQPDQTTEMLGALLRLMTIPEEM